MTDAGRALPGPVETYMSRLLALWQQRTGDACH